MKLSGKDITIICYYLLVVAAFINLLHLWVISYGNNYTVSFTTNSIGEFGIEFAMFGWVLIYSLIMLIDKKVIEWKTK